MYLSVATLAQASQMAHTSGSVDQHADLISRAQLLEGFPSYQAVLDDGLPNEEARSADARVHKKIYHEENVPQAWPGDRSLPTRSGGFL